MKDKMSREYKAYQHIERFGTDEVEGIEIGTTYVFPKIDGTNGQIWFEDSKVKCGSRKRELTLDNDNADFYNTIIKDYRYVDYFKLHPDHQLFGEWLVPHTLKTYREDTWRKFYIFDVYKDRKPIPYFNYYQILDYFNLDYIPPLRMFTNGTQEAFVRCLEENKFLLKDGAGIGEGIVIKNYNFSNKYGRTTWAKIIANEYLDKKHKIKDNVPFTEIKCVEQQIVDKFVTADFASKEYVKMIVDKGGVWRAQFIGEFLGRTWNTFINEEIWNILKEFKHPTVDFGKLNKLFIQRIKEFRTDIF